MHIVHACITACCAYISRVGILCMHVCMLCLDDDNILCMHDGILQMHVDIGHECWHIVHAWWHGLFNECFRHVRNIVHVKFETDHPHSVEMAFYTYLPNVLGSRFLGANQALALMLPAPPVLLYAHVSMHAFAHQHALHTKHYPQHCLPPEEVGS